MSVAKFGYIDITGYFFYRINYKKNPCFQFFKEVLEYGLKSKNVFFIIDITEYVEPSISTY